MREIVERFVGTLEARDWDAWSALLHPDVVYEAPQTRERVVGRDAYLRVNQEWAGDWHLALRRAHADADGGVAWIDATLDGEPMTGVVWLSFDADRLVTGVTDFWPEDYPAPPERAHLVDGA